jgi:hypothetical protein
LLLNLILINNIESMSYAVGSSSKPRGQPKGYSAISDDEEQLANPLISGNAKR